MELTQRLYQQVEEIWGKYYEHPFVKGIGEGTLELEKFRYFLVQDYLYLLEYAKVFALGVVKSNQEEMMRKFADLVYSTLNSEMKIHKNYMKRLNITEEEIETAVVSLENVSYTSYMLWIGEKGTVLELLTAILACSWSYLLIGKKLNEIPNARNHPIFGEWIRGYCSEEYEKGNQEILDFVNQMGEHCTQEQYNCLKEIFIHCSRYELQFWDMAYEMRQ